MKKLTKRFWILAGIGGIAVAALLVYAWSRSGLVYSAVAMTGGELTGVGVEYSGTVSAVYVEPGQLVAEGDMLFELDTALLLAELESLTALRDALHSAPSRASGTGGVADAQAQAARRAALEHHIAAARTAEEAARLLAERLSVELAQARLARRRIELRGAVVPEAPGGAEVPGHSGLSANSGNSGVSEHSDALALAVAREQAVTAALEEAHAHVLRTAETRRAVVSGYVPVAAAPGAASGGVASRAIQSADDVEALIADVRGRLAAAAVHAPLAGRVRSTGVRVEETVPAGSVGIWLEPTGLDYVWVTALFEKEDALLLEPGMRVRIRTLGDAPREWKGYIERLEAEDDSPRQDSPLSAPVRIRFFDEENTGEFLPHLDENVGVIVERRMPRYSGAV